MSSINASHAVHPCAFVPDRILRRGLLPGSVATSASSPVVLAASTGDRTLALPSLPIRRKRADADGDDDEKLKAPAAAKKRAITLTASMSANKDSSTQSSRCKRVEDDDDKSQRKRDTSRTSAAVKSKAPVQSSRRNRPTKSKPEKSEPVARKRKPSEPETLSDWILHPSGDWSYNPKGQ